MSMKGLVINTENKMEVADFGEPAYETIEIGRASCRERVFRAV